MTETADLPPANDPALAVAERQLAVLGELAEMAMVVSRAYAHAAVAASHAVEQILADEYWQPETGRARALAGAKDAADAFQKVSRALRLTLVLEASTAEAVRDLRAGVAPKARSASGTARGAFLTSDGEPAQAPRQADRPDPSPTTEPNGRDAERLVEVERPDRPYPGGFRATVNGACAEIGATVDWNTLALTKPKLAYQPFTPRPPGWETKPPPDRPSPRLRGGTDREPPLPP